MEKLNLYDVDRAYVSYLQKKEVEKRGFTRVPNMEYQGREQKFLCGIIMEINQIQYYVPVSSYKKKQSENLLIVFKNDRDPVKGSLRFNYMFPIPKEVVQIRIIDAEKSEKRKIFLAKQLNFFNAEAETIYRKAETTYKRILKGYSPSLVKNSCDFRLLEAACKEYCKFHEPVQQRLSLDTLQEDIRKHRQAESGDLKSAEKNKNDLIR